jgi:hypothetical protein
MDDLITGTPSWTRLPLREHGQSPVQHGQNYTSGLREVSFTPLVTYNEQSSGLELLLTGLAPRVGLEFREVLRRRVTLTHGWHTCLQGFSRSITNGGAQLPRLGVPPCDDEIVADRLCEWIYRSLFVSVDLNGDNGG